MLTQEETKRCIFCFWREGEGGGARSRILPPTCTQGSLSLSPKASCIPSRTACTAMTVGGGRKGREERDAKKVSFEGRQKGGLFLSHHKSQRDEKKGTTGSGEGGCGVKGVRGGRTVGGAHILSALALASQQVLVHLCFLFSLLCMSGVAHTMLARCWFVKIIFFSHPSPLRK